MYTITSVPFVQGHFLAQSFSDGDLPILTGYDSVRVDYTSIIPLFLCRTEIYSMNRIFRMNSYIVGQQTIGW